MLAAGRALTPRWSEGTTTNPQPTHPNRETSLNQRPRHFCDASVTDRAQAVRFSGLPFPGWWVEGGRSVMTDGDEQPVRRLSPGPALRGGVPSLWWVPAALDSGWPTRPSTATPCAAKRLRPPPSPGAHDNPAPRSSRRLRAPTPAATGTTQTGHTPEQPGSFLSGGVLRLGLGVTPLAQVGTQGRPYNRRL